MLRGSQLLRVLLFQTGNLGSQVSMSQLHLLRRLHFELLNSKLLLQHYSMLLGINDAYIIRRMRLTLKMESNSVAFAVATLHASLARARLGAYDSRRGRVSLSCSTYVACLSAMAELPGTSTCGAGSATAMLSTGSTPRLPIGTSFCNTGLASWHGDAFSLLNNPNYELIMQG